MKVAVIVFPGTNCELDTKYAYEKLGADVSLIWHKEEFLPSCDLVVLPGGFSYGDYLRSAAIARFAPIMKAVSEFAKKGGLVLGICNGFQMLTEMRLLPGALRQNDNIHFISKFAYVKVVSNDNPFLKNYKKGQILNIPVAHRDGNYYIDKNGYEKLAKNDQILLTYCDKNGENFNFNGSANFIAGVCNKEKTIFGLMPHPERVIEPVLGGTDGLDMLKALIA